MRIRAAAVRQAPLADAALSGPAKVYVEPTNRCNLACRTCLRTLWDEPPGDMDAATFARVLDGLRACVPVPTVFFGGIGEPLAHPRIIEMVAAAAAVGAPTELITNGTLLTSRRARALIDAGLGALWVSLDGATPASYTDVRLGAALPDVLTNMAWLRDLRDSLGSAGPEIGVVYVAMRRNIADLPAVLRLGRELGATRFMVTNVLAYSPDMCGEVLYARALCNGDYGPLPDVPGLRLPKLDRQWAESVPVREAVNGARAAASGLSRPVYDRCPFIEDGVLAVGWDGRISPCLPLLRTHTSYLHGCARLSRRYIVAHVGERGLPDVWRDSALAEFRERVRAFEFSPCTLCDGCLLSETNDEDCYGNSFPTCGGCLWAQGVVQCP